MTEIQIMEKPDFISYEVIHHVLWSANEQNRKNGFILKTSLLNSEDLEKRIGSDGKYFVAIDGDKVIGTIAVRINKRDKWYFKGYIPNYMLAAVIPEYQGKHINSLLAEKVFCFSKESGYKAIELDTAENNNHAIDVYKHQGFIPIDFTAKSNVDHYSVVMIKWLENCPYSKFIANFHFSLRRFLVKLRYKPGKIKRFGI